MNTKLLEDREEVELLRYIELVKSGVRPFKGNKKYVDTGSMETGKIIDSIDVDFETRPSRANMEVREDDILFAKMKDTEKVYLISVNDKNNIYSTGFSILRVKDRTKVLPKYVYFWLRTKEFQKKKNRECTGATQKAINEGKIRKFSITLPSLSNQEKIIPILEKAEKLKELRGEVDKLTKEYLKAIFLEMFCSSKENRWKEVMIEDLALPKKGSMRTGPFGSDLKHGEFVENGIAVLGIDNAVNNYFEWKGRRFITKEKYEKLKRYRIYPRDIIITIMATIARSAVIPDDIPLAINTKHLAAITPDENKVNPYFLSYSIHSNPYVQSQLESSNRGAIMPGLNLSIIKELKVKLPPLELQNQFEKIYHQITFLERFQKQSKEQIHNLFDNIMQKSFKGELAC